VAFDDFKQKESVIIVYTGEGKGKTSASLGLMARALGNRWNLAYIQFIKYWGVSEHVFIRDIQDIYKDKLYFYKGGKGFYKAGHLSSKQVSDKEHKDAALSTYKEALRAVTSNKYQLVICDEINNAVNDGLLSVKQLKDLIVKSKNNKVNLCLTGRDFPESLISLTDISTNMNKIKHHFDEKFLANKGIDY
jgi:cob(I)alamin adenosyltransferase